MGQGILLSGADDIDFMIHGVFSYELFGQTLWITTSHVCIAIVFLVILLFIFAANRAIKKGGEIPTGFQNVVELIVEKLDGMIDTTMGKSSSKAFPPVCTISGWHDRYYHGKKRTGIPQLYRYDFHFHSCQQYFRPVWP